MFGTAQLRGDALKPAPPDPPNLGDRRWGGLQSCHWIAATLLEASSAIIATAGLNHLSSGLVFSIVDDALTLAINAIHFSET